MITEKIERLIDYNLPKVLRTLLNCLFWSMWMGTVTSAFLVRFGNKLQYVWQ